MHDRNVKSLVNRLAVGALVSLASLATAAPAFADGSAQPLLISMLTPTASIGDTLAILEVRTAPTVENTVDLTAQHDDLWIRLRNGFAMTNLNDDLTLHYQQWYQNRPDALRRMVERSRPYLHHIVEELEARGMPTELALLPMVESSFNPMAYSRSHASASGSSSRRPASASISSKTGGRISAATSSLRPVPRSNTCRPSTTCTVTGTWRWPPTTGAKARSSGRSRRTRRRACRPTTPA